MCVYKTHFILCMLCMFVCVCVCVCVCVLRYAIHNSGVAFMLKKVSS